MAGLSVSVAPASEPVSTAQVKTHLRVTSSDEDTYISDLITAARQWVESYTWRALISQTLILKLDGFPDSGCPIWLPMPPLASVSSITYTDTSGDSQTLSTSNYVVDTSTERAAAGVYEANSQTWPSTLDEVNTVTVTYVAGYGSDATDVPQAIRSAIQMLAGAMFCSRVPCGDCGAFAQESTAGMLLAPYRVQNDLVGLSQW